MKNQWDQLIKALNIVNCWFINIKIAFFLKIVPTGLCLWCSKVAYFHTFLKVLPYLDYQILEVWNWILLTCIVSCHFPRKVNKIKLYILYVDKITGFMIKYHTINKKALTKSAQKRRFQRDDGCWKSYEFDFVFVASEPRERKPCGWVESLRDCCVNA